MNAAPLPNGSNGHERAAGGRGTGGRFVAGNPGGPGNPHARRVSAMRAAILAAVTDEDLKAIARALVKKAKGGDVPAARELLGRLVGDLAAAELEARIAALEEALVHEEHDS